MCGGGIYDKSAPIFCSIGGERHAGVARTCSSLARIGTAGSLSAQHIYAGERCAAGRRRNAWSLTTAAPGLLAPPMAPRPVGTIHFARAADGER